MWLGTRWVLRLGLAEWRAIVLKAERNVGAPEWYGRSLLPEAVTEVGHYPLNADYEPHHTHALP